MMKAASLLMGGLLVVLMMMGWTTVRVSGQGTLGFTFRGDTIPNNGYIQWRDVGEGDDALICTTTDADCCTTTSGVQFVFPNNNALPEGSDNARSNGFYMIRDSGQILLSRSTSDHTDVVTGLFRCNIGDANAISINIVVVEVLSLTSFVTNNVGQLNCTATVQLDFRGPTTPPTFTWSLGGTTLPSGGGDTGMVSTVMSSGSNHRSTLTFNPSHAGTYICQVTAVTLMSDSSIEVLEVGTLGFMFRGDTIPNNGYIQWRDVGEGDDALICTTTITDCCTNTTSARFYSPNNNTVPVGSSNGNMFYMTRESGQIRLSRRGDTTDVVTGLFRCEIPGSNAIFINIVRVEVLSITSFVTNNVGQLNCTATVQLDSHGPTTTSPTFIWLLGGTTLPSGGGDTGMVSAAMSIGPNHASILMFNPSHTGKYTCQVTAVTLMNNNSIEVLEVGTLGFMFRGDTIPNNSSIQWRDVGEGDDALICTTTITDCCTNTTSARFYFPNDNIVPVGSSNARSNMFYMTRESGQIGLSRGGDTTDVVTGLFRCEIPGSNAIFINIVIVEVLPITSFVTNNVGQLNCTATVQLDFRGPTTTPPAFTWSLGGTTLPSGGGDTGMVSTVMSNGSNHMSILTFNPSHTGTYTCQVTAVTLMSNNFIEVLEVGTLGFTFRGNTIPNNGYIQLENVGEGDDALICTTTITNCCIDTTSARFYFPNNIPVPVGRDAAGTNGFYMTRESGQICLSRGDYTMKVSGLVQFRCEIPGSNTIIINIVRVQVDFLTSSFTNNVRQLTCTATVQLDFGFPPTTTTPTFTWSVGGTTLSIGSSNTSVVSEVISSGITHSSVLTINFLPLQSSQAGMYTCKVSAVALTDNRTIAVNFTDVGPLGFTFRGTPVPNNGYIRWRDIGEGDDALICTTSSATARFSFPNSNLVPEGRDAASTNGYYMTRESGHIRLNRRSGERGSIVSGIFHCEISDSVGSSAISIHIVRLLLSSITSTGTGQLMCTTVVWIDRFTGSTDPPTITWFDGNNMTVPNGGGDTRMVSTVMSSGSTHTSILHFSLSHTGIYTCQATVATLMDTKSINIVPPPTVMVDVPSGTLYAGTNITLTCSITVDDAVNTDVEVNVNWTPSSNRLIFQTTTTGSRPLFTSTVTVSPLNGSDTGFTCSAVFSGSSFTAFSPGMDTGDVNVQDPPSPTVDITVAGTSTAGDPHSLTCRVTTVENLIYAPTVMLTGPGVGQTDLEITGPIVSGPVTNLTFSFSPLHTSHGGQYTCRAVLDIQTAGISQLTGVASQNITVLVPSITVMVIGVTPSAGQNYSLTCTVRGADKLNPIITFQWFKTNPVSQVGTNSPILSFTPLRLSDAGQYRCDVTVSSTYLSQNVTAVSDNYELRMLATIFQIRLNGIADCRQWTLLNPREKSEDISDLLVQSVEQDCQCWLNITDVTFRCFSESETHVTFRARLNEIVLSHTNTSQLIPYIEQWISSTQFISVENVLLANNRSCPVIIVEDFSSPECPQVPPDQPTDQSSSTNAIAGGVAVVLVLLLIVVVVSVMIIVIVKRRSKIKDSNRPVIIREMELPPIPIEANVSYDTIVVKPDLEDYEYANETKVNEVYEEIGNAQ